VGGCAHTIAWYGNVIECMGGGGETYFIFSL